MSNANTNADPAGLWTINVNGTPHTGAYSTKAEAVRKLPDIRAHFPDKRDVVEVAPHGAPGAKFATTDAPGTLGVKGASGSYQEPGSAQMPSEGMVPGAGGVIETQTVPGAPGVTTTSVHQGTNADLPGSKAGQSGKK